MHNKVNKTKTITVVAHEFHCDDCGAYLGASEEYDDGWYKQIGNFNLRYYTSQDWYVLNKHLCDTCKEKLLSKLCATLEDMGFKSEQYFESKNVK